MKYRDYWPPLVQDIYEFGCLDLALTPEIQKIREETKSLADDILIETAPIPIIARYESIYGIKPVNDLYLRRMNIRSRLANKVPFTEEWLINKFDSLVGKGNHEIAVDSVRFIISTVVKTDKENILVELKHELRKQVPSNMEIYTASLDKSNNTTFIGAAIHQSDEFAFNQNKEE